LAIVVEHEKRKQEILEKSLDVFVEEGYEDATFQKIADRCGITRTTLYIYFHNKREIFLRSIKQLLSNLEVSLLELVADDSESAKEKLKKTITLVLEECLANKKLFNVLLEYLLQLKKSGVDTNTRVLRRVIKLRHILSSIIIKGIQSNEFKNLNVHEINDVIYALIETYIFRMTLLNQDDLTEYLNTINLTLEKFCK
jgi:AcrR family transcriptional regulator